MDCKCSQSTSIGHNHYDGTLSSQPLHFPRAETNESFAQKHQKNFGAAWNGVDYKVYSVAASPVIYYGGSGGYGRCGGPHGNCGVCVEAVNNAAGHRAIFVINDLCPAGSPWCSGDRLHFDLLVSDATTQHPFGGNVEVDFAEIQCPAEVQQMRASTCFCLARNEISPEHLTRHLLQKAQPSGQQHIRY